MEKTFWITLILITALIVTHPVHAENVAGSSAEILSSNSSYAIDIAAQRDLYVKKKVIKKMLEKYGSPMADSVDAFIITCEKYNLNCYLLPSIAILESTFGKFIYQGSYNPFGWGRGYMMFKDWAEAIDTVGNGLKNNYFDKGANSIEQIGRIYSESPTWAQRINYIERQFEKEEEQNQLYLSANEVK